MLIFQKTFKGMLEVLKPLEMEQKNWINNYFRQVKR